MIAVTGANGHSGKLVIEGLVERVPANQIIAAVRSLEKASSFGTLGVRVREADCTRPETLSTALHGVRRVLLISAAEVSQRFKKHKAVIDAGKKAGTELLVYTSLLRADSSELFLAREHKQTEENIRAADLPSVILRNGWYLENHTSALGNSVEDGVLIGSSKDGRFESTSRADYAAAANQNASRFHDQYLAECPVSRRSQTHVDDTTLAVLTSNDGRFISSVRAKSISLLRSNMITGLKRILQFVAISAALPYFIQAQERGALTTLIDASARRLELAREVALAKWDDGAPVEDVARERHVIQAAITAGRQAGLPAEFVSRFFSAQIEANKLIQYALLTKWQGQGKAPRHSRINLAQTVRPQIDRIQAVLISALVNRTSSRSRASCRAQLAEAIKDRKIADPEISERLFSTALERALGPLWDAAD